MNGAPATLCMVRCINSQTTCQPHSCTAWEGLRAQISVSRAAKLLSEAWNAYTLAIGTSRPSNASQEEMQRPGRRHLSSTEQMLEHPLTSLALLSLKTIQGHHGVFSRPGRYTSVASQRSRTLSWARLSAKSTVVAGAVSASLQGEIDRQRLPSGFSFKLDEASRKHAACFV